MNRLFWIIISAWFAFSLQACSGSSSSSNDENDPDEYEDEYDGEGGDNGKGDGNSSGSRWDKKSSGVVQKDSLGNPISSAGEPGKPGEPGESGNSSSSTGPVVGIKDTVIVDTTAVVDVDALPECTADNEGESFLVKSENILYFCLAKEWVPSDAVAQTAGISCRNGVMVTGVNADDDDDGGSSTGGYSSPWGNFGGGGNSVNTSAVDDSSAVPRMVGAHLVGVAEKGPFRYGTSIKLIELDSTQHLADSKRTHKTCILNGDGNYSFDSVDFVSPYLRVKANGFFRNELTGGLSSKPVTLEAVVDVTEKDTVNVNILTHMEAPRVLKLVENSGNNQPVRAVKAQALREILSSFEIQWDKSSGSSSGGNNGGFGGWNFGGQQQQTLTTDGRFAEDIGLFDGDEYSGALLAISIMMQRNGSGSEMTSYAAGIADRIKGNGNWDDNNAKADLADWLMVLDTSGSYATIRNNIASWKMGEVPDFEKHLKRFWSRAYNFGDCNAQKADSVFCISNSLSAYFCGGGYDQPGPTVRFICDANTHEWRAATAVEKDTYGYGKGEYPGQIKNGRVNKEAYYVYDNGKWRLATSDDIQEFEDIEDVYKSLQAGEKVIFFLRHAKRSDDTGKNGHLTDEGKAQSKSVGEKFKGEDIYFANSNYTRSYETCDNIAIGAGMSGAEKNVIDDLDGEWYVKDNNKLEQYKSNNGGGWVVASEYTYKGSYSDAYYDLEEYSEKYITEVIKPEFSKVKKVGVFISHDMFVVPLTAYFTNMKVNLRYFDTKQWINYLAGLAIIMGKDGTIRYVPVRGLDSGTMTM